MAYELSVTPVFVPLAIRTMVRFRAVQVFSHGRLPLPRAVITLAGRRTRTDRHGRATLRLRADRREAHRALLQVGGRTVAQVVVAFG